MSRILFQYKPGIDYGSLHKEYMKHHPFVPLVWSEQKRIKSFDIPSFLASKQGGLRVLVLVNDDLYAKQPIHEKIDRYCNDIQTAYGGEVILITVSGGSPEEIKALIQSYYYSGGLDGAVFMGRIVPAWYEVSNDHYWWEGGHGYADWTCDLSYMDLDGQWKDKDANGIYDSHIAGAGDILPEIFVARIDTSTMLHYGGEKFLLNRYLDKNHQYWTGNILLNRFGLVYHDHDWRNEPFHYFNYFFGLGNYESRKWNLS